MSSFIFDDVSNQEIQVDQVRFAIGGRDYGLVSSEWFATASRKDIFMGTRGLARDIKVTFHERDAIVAFVGEKREEHRQRGFLRPGQSRQRTMVSIPSTGAWEAARIDFVYGTLRPRDRANPLRTKPIALISPPAPGHVTRIFVVHSYGDPGTLLLPDGQRPLPIAGLSVGNRHLRFFAADLPIDVEKEAESLRRLVHQIPDFEGGRELAERGDLAMVFWGDDGKALTFGEIHTIEVANPCERP